jgi:hypothetical protein
LNLNDLDAFKLINISGMKDPHLKIYENNVEAKREEMKLVDFDLWNATQIFWDFKALDGNVKSAFEIHLDPLRERVDWVDDDTIVNVFANMGAGKHYWLDLVESTQTVFLIVGRNGKKMKILPVQLDLSFIFKTRRGMSTKFGFGQEIKMDPLENPLDTFNVTFLDC